MNKRTRSTRQYKGKKNEAKNYSDDELIDYSVFDHITKKTKKDKPNSNKFFSLVFIMMFAFSAFLAFGVFSPDNSDSNSDAWSIEITDGAKKIPVVLYSSPTCGCCHKYVDYLDDNGFDTFQKRTEDYKDIKDQNNIPENLRSCHTAIIGNYFVEGHIPVQVIYDMLNSLPDFDGITLPNMPSGSPGMGGDKNMPWEISSIKDGENIGIFQTL